jgi:hypothetical protein
MTVSLINGKSLLLPPSSFLPPSSIRQRMRQRMHPSTSQRLRLPTSQRLRLPTSQRLRLPASRSSRPRPPLHLHLHSKRSAVCPAAYKEKVMKCISQVFLQRDNLDGCSRTEKYFAEELKVCYFFMRYALWQPQQSKTSVSKTRAPTFAGFML